MKASTLFLAGSLSVNVALLVLFVGGLTREESSLAASTAPRSIAKDNFGRGPNHSDIDPKIWADLQPAGLSGFYERLRAAGLSPSIARALLTTQVRAQFASRRAELNRKVAEHPFWEPATPDPATTAALGQLVREENQAIKDLLGPEATLDEAAIAILRRQFPDFSDSKIAAIQRSRQDVTEKMQELLFTEGLIPPELAVLMKQRETDIALLLTPQEREEYELRTSSIASSRLLQQLAGFEPTEDEFRAIYRLHRAYEESAKQPTGAARLSVATGDPDRQLLDQVKALLGEQRYADYLRSMDPGYQQTARLTVRLDLPAEAANQVYAVQLEIQQRAAALQSDRQLSPDERNAQLGALAPEAQSKVSAVLGPRGFEAYKQSGGSWIINLQPRPARASPRN